ncbi:MAG: DUF4339 domain-containing protein [Blastochloris sp.]|nr:DUF4339 domain-containing protein [Blastochloris sp.]
MKQWYYAQNGERKGPLDKATVLNLYQNGQIRADDLVWEEGMSDWVKASTVLTSTNINTPVPNLSTPAGPNPLSPDTSGNLPDYGDFLCWGIALMLIPCLGFATFIALIVFHILELIAVREKVQAGQAQASSYSNVHPVLMALGLLCCGFIFYPLFMHWRNETKLFKPQPHAVWFSIVILGIVLILWTSLQFLNAFMNLSSLNNL